MGVSSLAGAEGASGFGSEGFSDVLAGASNAIFAGSDETGAFGFSTGGAKGIFGSSGVNGKGVGTGGPLEAGTLSDADPPVPFGEISKGILNSVGLPDPAGSSGGEVGAGGSLFGLSAG
jgi:hypothetical protein